MAKQYLQIDSEQYAQEFALIREYAELLGLKNTTALMLHIRRSMPAAIQSLRSAPSEMKTPSVWEA
jgi:hypothetical protein